jgi:hypothetical protein
MNRQTFKIKKTFVLPFAAVVSLLFVLLMLSFAKGQLGERIILAVSCLGTAAVCIEASQREITIGDDGLTIKKFFRIKDFSWKEITHLAVVNIGKKAYFLLTTTKGFYFFSNMYEQHASLIKSMVDKLDAEKVEVEVKDYLEHPVERLSIILLGWLAAVLVLVFIILKLWAV